MMIVVSTVSQSNMGDIKLEKWSNSFIRSSSSAALLIGFSLAQ